MLAACLVSGLGTGVEDAAAAVNSVSVFKTFEFGTVAADADLGGTVVISPAGGKSVTGGASDFGGAHRPGQWRINTQSKGDPYSCIIPSSIQVASGGNSATVDTFTTSAPLSGNLPPNSKRLTMFIGGTLHLAAGQAAGNYSGSFTMTCDGFGDTGTVNATVAAPISISAGASMDFGTMVPTINPGTVTVTPAGAISSVNVDLLGGTPAAATFDVTGATGQAYSITLPPPATLTSAGGDTMTVDPFSSLPAGTGTLSGAGTETLLVGGTLNVGAAQAAGTYSGTFSVTVNYN